MLHNVCQYQLMASMEPGKLKRFLALFLLCLLFAAPSAEAKKRRRRKSRRKKPAATQPKASKRTESAASAPAVEGVEVEGVEVDGGEDGGDGSASDSGTSAAGAGGAADPLDEEVEMPDESTTPDPDASAAPKQMAPEAIRRARKAAWKDIVVLPRRYFLKRRRVSLTPFIGTTINDTLIQHTAIGAEINYYLSEIFAVGLQGIFYVSNVLGNEFNARYHFNVVPSLNKYLYSASGNFSYTPIHGKFTIFNKKIFYYDVWVSGGLGITGTEVIPRDLNNESFSNISLTFPLGIGARFYATRWLSIDVALRDYMMLDTFEATGRQSVSGDEAKENESETQFINNVVLSAGISFYLPVNFSYSTYR